MNHGAGRSVAPGTNPYPGKVRRAITVESRFEENGDLVFEAELHDQWISPDGAAQDDIHHYRMQVTANGPDLEITAIDATPLALPMMECGLAPRALQSLVGSTLRKGFHPRAKAALGSTEGCTHLLTLVTAVAASAVPAGYLMAQPEIAAGLPFRPRGGESHVGVCAGWKEGGSIVTMMREGRPYYPNWVASTDMVPPANPSH